MIVCMHMMYKHNQTHVMQLSKSANVAAEFDRTCTKWGTRTSFTRVMYFLSSCLRPREPVQGTAIFHGWECQKGGHEIAVAS